MSEWFITDDDCLQCCRPIPEIDPDRYEFVQVNRLPGNENSKALYEIAQAVIDIKNYSEEEILGALNFFGYEDMDDFVFQNATSDEWVYLPDGSLDRENSPSYVIDYQLIAEMLFEMKSLEEYGDRSYISWNEAVERINKITGFDFEKEREETVPNILLVIERTKDGFEANYLSTSAELFTEEFIQNNASGMMNRNFFMSYHDPSTYENTYAIYEIDPVDNEYRMAEITAMFLEGTWNSKDVILKAGYNPPIPQTWFNVSEKISAGVKSMLPQLLKPFLQEEWNKETLPEYCKNLEKVFSALKLTKVERQRMSVTQGEAVISCNGKEIVRYGDDMWLRKQNGKLTNGFREEEGPLYGAVINGWGSRKSDSDLIRAALTQYPDRFAEALTPAKPLNLLIEDAKNRKTQMQTKIKEHPQKEL